MFKITLIVLLLSFSTASAQPYCDAIAKDIEEVIYLSGNGATKDYLFSEFMANRGSMKAVDMAEYAMLVLAWVFTQKRGAEDFMDMCED